jgi:hypothetical protein
MTADLIARLREAAATGKPGCWNMLATSELYAAADSLEAQALEITELKAKCHESAEQFVNFIHKEHSEMATDRDTWKARAEFSYRERDSLAEQNNVLRSAINKAIPWLSGPYQGQNDAQSACFSALATGGK